MWIVEDTKIFDLKYKYLPKSVLCLSFILGLARNITKIFSERGPKIESDGTKRLVETRIRDPFSNLIVNYNLIKLAQMTNMIFFFIEIFAKFFLRTSLSRIFSFLFHKGKA